MAVNCQNDSEEPTVFLVLFRLLSAITLKPNLFFILKLNQ